MITKENFPDADYGKNVWPWMTSSEPTPERMPDGSTWPKISIITPSFNQAQYLEETIRSVLLQGYPNLEYIVIDGGSIDGSVEIIKKYEPWLTYWVSEPDNGQTYAIKKGMDKASGELVNWLNSDDILNQGALENLAYEYHVSKKEKIILCGHTDYMDQFGRVVNKSYCRYINYENRMLPQSPPVIGGSQSSSFFTKKVWDTIGGINVTRNYTMDTDLMYKACEHNVTFVIIDHSLTSFRLHDQTKTHKGWEESINYKKDFYYSKLNQLDDKQKRIYAPRVRRAIYGFCMASIWPSDQVRMRLKKLQKALSSYPESLLQPFQIKRILKIIFP